MDFPGTFRSYWAHRYVKTNYINENVLVFVGPFYHRCAQKPVHENVLRNVQMRLISHHQPKPSEVFVEMQKPEPIHRKIRDSRFHLLYQQSYNSVLSLLLPFGEISVFDIFYCHVEGWLMQLSMLASNKNNFFSPENQRMKMSFLPLHAT